MRAAVHELEFTGRVVGWIAQLIQNNGPDFPISEARIEGRAPGSQKRRDLTLYHRDGSPCLTGEVKLPWAPDGHSPFFEDVVLDAREKAEKAGVQWFITWNLNELVLWHRDDLGVLGTARTLERYQIANVQRATDLDHPRVLQAIRNELERFIILFARTLRGERDVQRRPPDLYFIHSLESFLDRPIQLTRLELTERYGRQKEKERLDSWMRDRQGWTLGGDQDDLLLRAAKFTNYTVANRLIFYEALRKRFSRLRPLDVPGHVDAGDRLLDHLRAFFDEACHVTGDYETVFGIDPNDVGDRIPFYANAVVPSWRLLTQHVHRFDFSHLEYDVIGQIFETLIGPEERHKYGQYYTRPEVVDLINSFCIRNGEDRIMDPGCGGGTFLVRAYARKRHLAPRLDHLGLLRGIFGVDISRFATHLSTINLAVRDLIDAQNYPRVVRSDFFELQHDSPLMTLPGAGRQEIQVRADSLDAIVANPPYVRQEDIPREKKERYRALVKREVQIEPSGRSDLHVYFWGHAVSFLRRDGWLRFLTSSQWLDVEYGFPLQSFVLQRFRIGAIIESRIEPWFVGARVQTVVTVGQLEQDEGRRAENVVKFVEIRRPMADVLTSDGTSAGAIAAADEFRDLILNTTADTTTDSYRIRCVRQGDLLEEGLRNGEVLRRKRIYAGAKWGIRLRAPNLWEELQALGGSRWRPLGELAEVRRGLTTGADKFFYVNDITAEALAGIADPIVFEAHYGLPRSLVADESVRIIKNGYGEAHPIEAEYLEPVVHSLMDIDRYEVTVEHCEYLVLMVGQPFDALEGRFVAAYLRRGEQIGIHNIVTVAARASAMRAWYDLTNAHKADLLWAESHQYRHCAPLNPQRFTANCNLYTVHRDDEPTVAAAVLNSSIVLLSKHLYGRPVGVESNLKTEVVDVNMMPVPDWTQADQRLRARLTAAFDQFRTRNVLVVLSERRLRTAALLQRGLLERLDELDDSTEFDQADRQELDDAVLELLGVPDATHRRDLRENLYAYLSEYFESARRKEEQAIVNKVIAKRRDKLTPQALALDVFAAVENDHPVLLKGYRDLADEDGAVAVEGIRIPGHKSAELVDDLLTTGVRFSRGRGNGEIVQTRSADQARLVLKIVELGEKGRNEFVPIEKPVIVRQMARIDAHLRRRRARVRELIEARTSDPELGRRAFDLVMARF